AAQRRLAEAETDPVQAREVAAINAALTAYASRPDDAAYDAVRARLSRYLAAEQAELLERRARSTTLRNRSIVTASAGLVVLLVLITLFGLTAAQLAQAQAQLRRGSERHLAELEAVFASAPLGLAFVGPDLRFLRANEALAEMDGRPAAE